MLCQGTGVPGVSRIVTQGFLFSSPFLGVLNDHGIDVLRELLVTIQNLELQLLM